MSGIAVKVAVVIAALDDLAGCDIGRSTAEELRPVMDDVETLMRRMPAQFQRMLARLQTETTPTEMGAKTWNEVLRTRWRLSRGEAGRRLAEARDLHPRPTISADPLPPKMPAIAAAQAAGAITTEQLGVLRKTMNTLPGWVDPATATGVEVDLVRIAVGAGYQQLRDAAALRLFLLDQDGPEPDDRERDRRRGARVGEQGRDGMTALNAVLDPETAALWGVLFAKFAAPGMCNPADEQPCVTGTPTAAQIAADDRSPAQRRHDALTAVGRIAVMTDPGTLNGLPVSVIIRTTLTDLESRGIAIAGDGTRLSIGDLNRLGAHAAYHLCVFDGATGSALNHFRAKRVATPAQRVMLIAKYGGCTKPGCPVGPYGCQIHHAVADWADDGLTNVDDMAPACGGHNRMVGPHGYTTVITDTGECAWIPPPGLDTGQTRINVLHRPDLLLTPHHDPPTEDDDGDGTGHGDDIGEGDRDGDGDGAVCGVDGESVGTSTISAPPPADDDDRTWADIILDDQRARAAAEDDTDTAAREPQPDKPAPDDDDEPNWADIILDDMRARAAAPPRTQTPNRPPTGNERPGRANPNPSARAARPNAAPPRPRTPNLRRTTTPTPVSIRGRSFVSTPAPSTPQPKRPALAPRFVAPSVAARRRRHYARTTLGFAAVRPLRPSEAWCSRALRVTIVLVYAERSTPTPQTFRRAPAAASNPTPEPRPGSRKEFFGAFVGVIACGVVIVAAIVLVAVSLR
ncbi:DUF222 domain-containing protein, partial [Micrococcus luteus]|uniref:HNH endonuclease signature motif containing protein n=1 Tax=Micrococcus luteus TaxID=1270 RepID=UPI00343288B9